MEPRKNLIEEADIGSGEKSPGERETQKMIEQVGKDRERDKAPPASTQNLPDPATQGGAEGGKGGSNETANRAQDTSGKPAP